jgi:hypothetical protein
MPTAAEQEVADKAKYNTDLATRQVQINEWAYEDKMDTLFVFQVVFMSILFLIILFYLKEVGIFPSSFTWYVVFVLALIIGLIIINRAAFTARRRDKRFWNRRRQSDDRSLESPVGKGDASYLEYIDKVRSTYGPKQTCAPGCTPAAASSKS